jgi:hypothetical protein
MVISFPDILFPRQGIKGTFAVMGADILPAWEATTIFPKVYTATQNFPAGGEAEVINKGLLALSVDVHNVNH